MTYKTRKKFRWATLGLMGYVAAKAAIRRSRRFDLRGKNVLITGGSRGLGLLLAREFAKQRARVAVCARKREELEQVEREFASKGEDFLALTCDVSNQKAVAEMVASVERSWGSVDVLVNNAGVISMGPVENQTIDDFERAMRVNFWGPLYTTMAVLPQMQRRHSGRIVNITSIGGKLAVPHLLPYSASKFAFVGFSEGLRAELLKDKIFVTTVCPTLMRTGSPRNADVKGQHGKEYTWFILGDSIPGPSISAKRAARQIVRACVNGESEVILGISAKLAAKMVGLAPGITSDALGAVNQWMLPEPAAVDTGRRKGFESETPLTRNPLTALTRAAERANNEL